MRLELTGEVYRATVVGSVRAEIGREVVVGDRWSAKRPQDRDFEGRDYSLTMKAGRWFMSYNGTQEGLF
jgi:hypothetical protein